MMEALAEAGAGELVVLGLGSNMGDSAGILRGAVNALSHCLSGLAVSSLYVTAPQDYVDQPHFFNAAVAGRFAYSPDELLFVANSIEADFGRDRAREIPKGPRALDIDILLFGDRVVSLRRPDLAIPHRSLGMRQFALIPMLEVLPLAADPLTGVLYRDILANLPDQGVRRREGFLWH